MVAATAHKLSSSVNCPACRCIMALTLLAVLGLVAMIILKVLHVGDKSSTPTVSPAAQIQPVHTVVPA